MAYLYTNAKGCKVTRHSHSAGTDWNFCPRYYDLKRRQGWKERRETAAQYLGKAIEAAIQAHCENGADLYAIFDREWGKIKDKPGVVYTQTERDWERMRKIGRDMLRLFEARLPYLPIVRPRFQRELNPEVFPNTKFAGITFTSYLDIISSPPFDHPALPYAENPNGKPFRPLIVDIKVKGKAYPDDPRMIVQSPQLKKYSWSSGIADVAILNFIKASPEIKRGSRVQLLENVSLSTMAWVAGFELIAVEPEEIEVEIALEPDAAETVKKKSANPKIERRQTGGWYVVPALESHEKVLDKIGEELGGKEEKAARIAYCAENGAVVGGDALTTVRIQFLAVRMPKEKAEDAGRQIGREIVEIENAERTGIFPELGGIDYPNDKCVRCCMRGICSGDDKLRDELLTKTGEEWLEELDGESE